MSADYSQIEMRVMAHLSGDEGLIEAFRTGEDLHSFVGSQVFDVEPDDVTAAMRSKVKAMSYGLAYGLSAFGLSKQLTISTGEAQGLMDEYFARFGGVRDYLREVVAEARGTGYTATMLGRRRYLPDLTSDNRQRREMAERMALNAPIQGSAADIMKVAMLGVDRRSPSRARRRGCCSRCTTSSSSRSRRASARRVEELVRQRDGCRRRDGRAARRQRRGSVGAGTTPRTRHGAQAGPQPWWSTVDLTRGRGPLVRPGDPHQDGEQHRVDAEHEQQQGVPGGHEGHGGQDDGQGSPEPPHRMAVRAGEGRLHEQLDHRDDRAQHREEPQVRLHGGVGRSADERQRESRQEHRARDGPQPDAEDDAQAGEVQVPWPGAASEGGERHDGDEGGEEQHGLGQDQPRGVDAGLVRGQDYPGGEDVDLGQREEGEQGVRVVQHVAKDAVGWRREGPPGRRGAPPLTG